MHILLLVIESMVVAHTSGSKKRAWRYTEMTEKGKAVRNIREKELNRIERKVHSLNTAAPPSYTWSWSQHQQCQIIIFSPVNVLEAQGFRYFVFFRLYLKCKYTVIFRFAIEVCEIYKGWWWKWRFVVELIKGARNVTAIPESFTRNSGIVFFTRQGHSSGSWD